MMNDKLIHQIIEDTLILGGISDPDEEASFRVKYMELLDIVDDAGTRIGIAPRGLAHRVGLRHPVVYAAIYDRSGQMLLQRRGGGRWDIGVGGHVQAGEYDMAAALAREFDEELGVSVDQSALKLIATYNRDAPIKPKKPFERNRERRFVFEYVMDATAISDLDESFSSRTEVKEVTSFGWYTIDEVNQEVERGNVADGLFSSMEYLTQK